MSNTPSDEWVNSVRNYMVDYECDCDCFLCIGGAGCDDHCEIPPDDGDYLDQLFVSGNPDLIRDSYRGK